MNCESKGEGNEGDGEGDGEGNGNGDGEDEVFTRGWNGTWAMSSWLAMCGRVTCHVSHVTCHFFL